MKATKPNLTTVRNIKDFSVKGMITAFNGKLKSIGDLTFNYILENKSPELKTLKDTLFLTNADMRYCLAIERVTPYAKYCAVCGKQIHVNPHDTAKGYSNTCSKTCSAKDPARLAKLSIAHSSAEIIAQKQSKTIHTNLAKYGTKWAISSQKVQDKIKSAVIKKYGVDNVFKLQEFQDKATSTNLEKYGVKYSIMNPEVRKKAYLTMHERYGVNSIFSNKDYIKQKLNDKYGVDNIMQVPEFCANQHNSILINLGLPLDSNLNMSQVDEIKNKKLETHCNTIYNSIINKCEEEGNIVIPNFSEQTYFYTRKAIKDKYEALFSWKCNECGRVFDACYANGQIPVCKHCHPTNYRGLQHEIKEFIESIYTGTIIEESKSVIAPQELDIYIPDKNIAIETNGDYWHSEKAGKDKRYHINKTVRCSAMGIKLIHIFEWQWRIKKEVIMHRIKNLLGVFDKRIFARKCEAKVIDFNSAKQFLDSYHIQGSVSSTINLGLYNDNELIAVMTFGKPRFTNCCEWELLRFATKYTIIGGASKLLKYFERNYNPKSLISYADLCWSSLLHNVYTTIGFKFLRNSEPSYWYIKENLVLSRHQAQKQKLANLLGDSFDITKTEDENMRAAGFNKVYDCGNLVFKKIY